MGKKNNEGDNVAAKTRKPFQILLSTPYQRKLAKRNREIFDFCRREVSKGSATLYVYDALAEIYGLSASQIGNICRKEARYA